MTEWVKGWNENQKKKKEESFPITLAGVILSEEQQQWDLF